MKKILSTVLVAVLLISCLAMAGFAAKAGDTVTVTFKATNNPGFATYGAQINYDKAALTLVKVDAGALSSGFFSAPASTGKVAYAGTQNVTGDGVLFTATFTINENAAAGTYPVTATLDTTTTANSAFAPVTFGITGGQVVVEVEATEPSTQPTEPSTQPTECPHTNTSYEYDNDQHWLVCDACDETVGQKVAHDFSNGNCVCGKAKPNDNLDDVPETGDITTHIAVAFIATVAAVVCTTVMINKRKAVK